MRAVVIPRFGSPDVLEVRSGVPEPQPEANQVVVNVKAAGVNFADILTAQGGYATTPPPPLVAGREFAGVVESTGEAVMGYVQFGAFAERIAVPSGFYWKCPPQWNAEQCAAFPVNYFTAWLAYWKAGLTGTPADKKRVLIHAAAGGVGTAAVQIGRALGVEMYGTSSSDEKLARVVALGLQHGINYKQADYEQAIRELTRGEGVDAVFEMLGGEHTSKSVRCLREFGGVIVYGSATGKESIIDTRLLYARSTSVHGLWLSRLAHNAVIMAEAWKKLSGWITDGKLRPIVGQVLPLARAADAYRLMLDRQNFGKIVLTI
jgi:NADPH:quinone reductase